MIFQRHFISSHLNNNVYHIMWIVRNKQKHNFNWTQVSYNVNIKPYMYIHRSYYNFNKDLFIMAILSTWQIDFLGGKYLVKDLLCWIYMNMLKWHFLFLHFFFYWQILQIHVFITIWVLIIFREIDNGRIIIVNS